MADSDKKKGVKSGWLILAALALWMLSRRGASAGAGGPALDGSDLQRAGASVALKLDYDGTAVFTTLNGLRYTDPKRLSRDLWSHFGDSAQVDGQPVTIFFHETPGLQSAAQGDVESFGRELRRVGFSVSYIKPTEQEQTP